MVELELLREIAGAGQAVSGSEHGSLHRPEQSPAQHIDELAQLFFHELRRASGRAGCIRFV